MLSRHLNRYEPPVLDTANLFASRSQNDHVVIGGLAADETQWAQTLTRRAALGLWFDLTRLLFPEKSDEVIAQVATMRSIPVMTSEPTEVTSAVFVTALHQGDCQIDGWMGRPGWRVRLSAFEVYRFWAELDKALYPTGW